MTYPLGLSRSVIKAIQVARKLGTVVLTADFTG